MIASPGDVGDGREAVLRAITGWNEANTRARGVVVVPLRWESVAPQAGDHPQAIINAALLDNADAIIGIFGSRVGTATPTAISGTVEEVDRAIVDGKRVHLWFSTAPHPNEVDLEQLGALRTFQEDLRQRSLYGTYANAEDLVVHVWRAIESDIDALGLGGAGATARSSGTRLVVQSGNENIAEQDSRGRLKNRVRRFIELTNAGDVDATDLTIRAGSRESNLLYEGDRPRTLHAGQTQQFRYDLSIADGIPTSAVVRWIEDGEEHEQTFDI